MKKILGIIVLGLLYFNNSIAEEYPNSWKMDINCKQGNNTWYESFFVVSVKNNEFIKKDTIIGQLAGNIKQTRTETKHIICGNSGEIFIPKLKSNINSIIQNKLIWILAGEVYQAPMASFLNLFYDYKINKNSFIFRSKLINQYPGFIKKIKNQNQLFQQAIKIVTNIFCLNNVVPPLILMGAHRNESAAIS